MNKILALGVAFMGGLLMTTSTASAQALPDPMAGASTPNGKLIVEFFNMSMNDRKAREAHEKFAAPTFVNHALDGHRDPTKSDRETNIANAEAVMARAPNLHVHILSVSVAGDYVVTQLMMTGFGVPSVAPCLDRIENGKVVEHWPFAGVSLKAAEALAQ